jgi:hypothetical protein
LHVRTTSIPSSWDIDPFSLMSPFLITFFNFTLLDDLPMFSQSRHTGEYAFEPETPRALDVVRQRFCGTPR